MSRNPRIDNRRSLHIISALYYHTIYHLKIIQLWEIVQKYDRISVKVEARKWNNIKKSLLISCWNLEC